MYIVRAQKNEQTNEVTALSQRAQGKNKHNALHPGLPDVNHMLGHCLALHPGLPELCCVNKFLLQM